MNRPRHWYTRTSRTLLVLSLTGTLSFAETPKKMTGIASPTPTAKTAEGKFLFPVYTDRSARTNHYVPSGWMGDYGDLKVDEGWKDKPKEGSTCIKITYSGKATQGANWAGIYWQYPPNNWGDKKGGYKLTGAKRFIYWARGEKGGEKIAEFKIGGITGEHADSDTASIGPVELTKEWKQYVIDLKDKDLSQISGGFCWAASRDDNPDGFILYLDDLRYE